MAGRPGRSGGHNKIPIAVHRLRGTYNSTRHRVPVMTATALARLEPVPAAVLEGLAGRGRAFVEECWAEYAGWTPATRALLHEAGRLLDELSTVRGQPHERAAQRLLLSVLAALEHAR